MAIHTQIQISLDGTIFDNIIDFSLKENISKHSEFKVSVRGQSLEDRLNGNSILESSRSYLGKPFLLEISGLQSFGYQNFYFKGTITQVRGKKGKEESGLGDVIDVVGYSNSILLDDGPHMNSFLEKSVSDIVLDTTSNYSNSEIKVVTNPENDAMISYAVQNKQSTFAYLQYLAASNGEYLLYNSDSLYFGKPDLGEQIILKYGIDLKDFSLGLETQSLNFNYFSNDYLSETNTQAAGSSMDSGATGYTAMVTDASTQTFPESNQLLFSTFEDANLQQRIDTAVGLQKKLAEQNQVTLYGESVNTGVSLGKIINIQSSEGSFGSYRVISVTHSYGIRGAYINTFTAVPLEIDIYPLTDISIVNHAQAQIAKVTDIADPDGMSRIKVQFPWQVATNQTTPWIRVATPYAGGGRGFHVLPEVNDEVLIGFENGEVERPFMQAALYTGVNKAQEWQSADNDIKAIQTRSGNKVIMNDANGSITIADPSGNVVLMQGNGEIVIQAPNKITLASKDINIVGSNSVNIHALPNEEGGDGTMSIYAQRDLGIETADESIGISANTHITIESKTASANLKADTDVNINSKDKINITSKDKVAIHGNSKTTISGGEVAINS